MATANRQEIKDYAGHANIELLINEITKLISLPDIYYRLEALIERPDSTLDDFTRLLATEPDLCARLLSLANSAFYCFPSTIESVDKAVQIIGIRQIRELVLATSVVNAFNQIPPGEVNMKLFWEHSVAVGVLAKCIGQYCRLPQPERFYVSGLLHDIGRLIFYVKLPGLMHDLLQQREDQQTLLYELEQQVLGYSHAEAGGLLLKNWQIPQSIYEPVLFHHDPQRADEFATVTAAVHVADIWINKYQMGSSGERFDLPCDEQALKHLNLQLEDMDQVWAEAAGQIREVFNQFLMQ